LKINPICRGIKVSALVDFSLLYVSNNFRTYYRL
jgi:hypothetical protein